MKIKTCAVIYNSDIPNATLVRDEVLDIIHQYDLEVKTFCISEMSTGFDIAFVIGGDGTLLKVARFFAETDTAIFGINMGRLGFLAQSSKENFANALEEILNSKYRVENRLMLETRGQVALNDFVIKAPDQARTASFLLKINDKPVCNYLADGVIISTPTGSTAYGLSAGGPVLSPDIEAIVIVPICPHTLNARPLVIPATEKITIAPTCDTQEFMLSVDGQRNHLVEGEITIKKSNLKSKLMILNDSEFYSILKAKLNWGVSPNYC